MIKIAQISCGTEYSGIQKEIEATARDVGATIVIPEVATEDINKAASEFGLKAASSGLKLMMARAKSIAEGRCNADGVLIATCFRCAEGAIVRNAIRSYIQVESQIPIVSYSFTERTKAGNFRLRMEALANIVAKKALLARTKQEGITAGIDSGSTTTKVAIMNNNQIIGTAWIPTVDIVETAQKAFQTALEQAKLQAKDIQAIGTTGYGRFLVGQSFKAKLIQDEITVNSKGSVFLADKQKGEATVLDIGGTDNKAITLHDGIPDSFTVGGICAGASGKFLEVCAKRLGIDVVELGDLALKGNYSKVMMNAYCIVFGMQDLTTALAEGTSPADVAAAACHSVAEQVFEQQLQEIDLRQPVIQVGGTSLVKGLVKAMEETLYMPVIVPPHSPFIGAVGSAVLVSGLLEDKK